MKAPGDKRPTWLGGVLQIHITRACDLSCTGCTQGSNLAGKPTVMSLENFEQACISLKDYHGVVGIFGGNPTMHPKFKEICEILSDVIPFEHRGLWSNNLRGYGELCRKVFNPSVSNLNVHTSQAAYNEMKRDWPESNPIGLDYDSRHSPPFVAMQDLDIPIEKQWELIQKCDVNQLWSAMICQFRGELRGFFCELAGAQSMLHEADPNYPDTGLKVFPGWWRLPIDSFEDQIYKHCFECGIPLKGQGDLAVNGKLEHVSKTHARIYQLKKIQSRTVRLVEKLSDLGGTVNRATDYIQNGAKSVNSAQSPTGTEVKNTRIMIGVPTPNYSRNDSFYDFYNLMDKPGGSLCSFSRGQSPARGRNMIIEQALTHDCTHIMFIDDDTAPPKDIIARLLAHDKDIVTGLYVMRTYPHQPIIFDFADEKGACLHHYLEDGNDGLVPIVAAGLGACLIKIEVFKKLEKPWIRLGELEPDHWCDDIGFFRRAREAGFKAYCDQSVTVGHFGQMTLMPVYQDGKWFTSYNTQGVQTVMIPQFNPKEERIAAQKEIEERMAAATK
jgi:organic radical activating enzyme